MAKAAEAATVTKSPEFTKAQDDPAVSGSSETAIDGSSGVKLSKEKANKGIKLNESDKDSDVKQISKSDLFDSEEVNLSMEGIQQLEVVDNLDESKLDMSLDSQTTSKAGLSYASMAGGGDDYTPISLSQQLKVIVPAADGTSSEGSADSSPRHHKLPAQHQEVLGEEGSQFTRGFKSFLSEKDLTENNPSTQS